ncbi:MAG: chromosomal replication initiator protein DnaA [Planctomycetota bacterium]|nr:chromosomal replication initiator protein DnaA [Planctomycetota bacterium]
MQHPLLSDPKLVWTSALDVLETELGPAEVDGWLRGAELLSMDQGLAKISVPTELHFERIRDRHLPSLCEALGVQNCELIVVELDIEQTLPPEDLRPTSNGADSSPLASSNGAALGAEPALEADPLLLNREYVFDTYVVGPCNRFAHAASHGVADRPGDAFNPLFLHGSVGLGKTHLMQAIAHRIRRNNPQALIAFLSCEEFINHFVGSLQQGSISHFRERYRNVDVLIVDDIQMLSNKQRTQEEFFHTFNALRTAQKQIILSSDAPPGEIPGLQERLVSRFKWGLVAEIESPCFETRVAILRRKADRMGVELPDLIAHFIAEHVDRNVRELEGTLTHLHALSQLNGLPISLPLARQALGSERNKKMQRIIRMDDILQTVIAHFGVRLAELQSKRRTQSIVYPRQVAMFLARNMTDHSLEEIGGHFGGRDHSTVVYAVEKMERRRRVDGDFASLLADLERKIRNNES